MRLALQGAYLAAIAVLGCVSHTMRYSDIEMLGVKTCPTRDSCRLIRSANFTDRNCECDQRCSFYDDCCIDAPAPRVSSKTRAICIPVGGSLLGVYVEATCSEGHPLDTQCRSDDFSDTFLSTPVTDPRTRRTYLNHYCAQCQGATSQLQPWTIHMDCAGGNVSWPEVTHGPGGWSARGQPCDLLFTWPPRLRPALRLCRANLTASCPLHYRRRTLLQACAAYLSVMVDREGVLYRNAHCALCNGVDVDDLACLTNIDTMGRGRKPFSFALLLDVNRSDGDLVGVSIPEENCPQGQKYDPFFKKCRELVCAIPGYTMSDGKCVKK